MEVYQAKVLWDGLPRTVDIDELDTDPLLGTFLLNGHELKIQFVFGGTVTVTPFP